MSGGGESFSSVAKQAADRLTDAVSNFTLYVIGLKKRNAEVPKELVQTVYLIATQCQHLVDMGRQLGHNFDEYPTIQGKMLSDSAALNSAAENLIASCRQVATSVTSESDRQLYWQRLSDSCSTIATKVITMLDVLGEAEIDRIFACAEETLRLLGESESIEISSAIADMDAYAQSIGASASSSQQLAEYLRTKAESEEVDSMRDLMLDTAHEIDTRAVELVESCNTFFAAESDTEQQQSHSHVRKLLDQQRQQIKHVLGRAQEQRDFLRGGSLATEKPPSISHSSHEEQHHDDHHDERVAYSDAAAHEQRTPKATAHQEHLDTHAPPAIDEQATSLARPIEQRTTSTNSLEREVAPVSKPAPAPAPAPATPAPAATWKPETMSEVATYMSDVASEATTKEHAVLAGASDLSAAITALARAAEQRDSAGLLAAARQIATLTNTFAQEIRKLASSTTNPRYKDRLMLCAASLRDLCQQLRILASVKATSELTHLDRDEQLVSLTGNLVRMWKETSDTVVMSHLDKTAATRKAK